MRLTLEALFGPAPLAGPVAAQIKLSPNGEIASYLRPLAEDRERLQLWLTALKTGRAWRLSLNLDAPLVTELTTEEKAERERRRSFAGGVTSYAWDMHSERILLSANGAAHLVKVSDGDTHTLTPPGTRQTGIRLSPRGRFASYVRGGNLFVGEVDNGSERQLTLDGGGTVTNGLPEFIAQEEMQRFDGHWWSPDERTVAFCRVDVAPVAESHRHEVLAGGIDVVPQRYPFAGEANAEVRLGMIDVATGATRWLRWALATDDYLARVQFDRDGVLYVQAQSRDQRRLTLRRFQNEQWEELLTEVSPTWVNLHDNLKFAGEHLLWTSERTGSAQLFVCGPDATMRPVEAGLRSVEAGLARVNRILAADAVHAWVTGWRDDPSTQDVFEVALDSGECRPLTDGLAWHDGVVNAKAGVALISRSAATGPGTVQAVDLRSRRFGRVVAGGKFTGSHAYFPYLDAHAESEFGDLQHAGETLHFRLTKPSPFAHGRRYPVLVHVYGGPGVQRVRREFAPLMLQIFAQAGFGVFELDNRGGGNRHKAFEDAIHGQLGDVEVEDQLAGVAYLRSLAWVDTERIGVFGHSYGGYMALKCVSVPKRKRVFAAAVSIAPVTRWQLYDTHYTERYLGTPAENPAGYDASSVLGTVETIDRPLLLIHGMADDNVLFTHSTELMRALQNADVPFELMTYPGSKHALQEPSVAIHRYRYILEFFRRTLAAR